jgi:large subunit ribosomal protein L24
MNAAKHARKLKHIRRVKNAIRYEENRRERLKPIKEQRQATKDYILQRLHLQKIQNQKIKAALQNADEDWKLGPLRPNRAVGYDPAAYGAANRNTYDGHITHASFPDHWYGADPKVQKRMKERIPTNVLLNQWPIVAGDRVVVVRGLYANKVGKVLDVDKEDNTVTVEGIDEVSRI